MKAQDIKILPQKTAGILLAAGSSVRMGEPKLLLPVGNDTLVGRVLNETLNSDLDEIILVLGHKAEMIRAAIEKKRNHPKLRVVHNLQYKSGISSSIRAGMSLVKDYDHVMILLADMPYINRRLINSFLRKYHHSRLDLGAVEVNNKRSHPVIFSKKHFSELDQLEGDVGAKSLFQKYGDAVCLIKPEVFYDDRDIDTPRDFNEFKKTFEG